MMIESIIVYDVMLSDSSLFLQVENLGIPEAAELRKLKLLKEELGELAAQGGWPASH